MSEFPWTIGFGSIRCAHDIGVAVALELFPGAPKEIAELDPWPCDVCTPHQLHSDMGLLRTERDGRIFLQAAEKTPLELSPQADGDDRLQ